MSVTEGLRSFSETRPELLIELAERLLGPGARLAVDGVDRPTAAHDPKRVDPRRLILPEFGALRLLDSSGASAGGAPVASDWQGAVERLLAACVESEAELSALMDEHIATTNQLVALFNILYGTPETWELSDKLDAIVAEAGRQCQASLVLLIERESARGRHLWTRGEDDELLADEIHVLAREESAPYLGLEPRDFLSAPILVHGENVGSLVVVNRKTSEVYGSPQLKLVQALADLASGFLLTARLQDRVLQSSRLERELELASEIQQLLIPHRLPRPRGCQLAGACLPASQVGGDFFAVDERPDGRLFFALGDVTGKGVPAALLMAMTRTAFFSLTAEGVAPQEIVARLNRVLYEDLGRVQKFVTLAVGCFDPDAREVTLANAGHSPVFHLAANGGEPRLLEPEAPPLGVLAELQSGVVTCRLQAGDLLLLTSDGVTEARDASGELFGTERLSRWLRRAERDGADHSVQALLGEVARFGAGTPQGDDQTILLLRGSA